MRLRFLYQFLSGKVTIMFFHDNFKGSPGLEITKKIVHDFRARLSCTIFVHESRFFFNRARFSCHDFHNFIDFALEYIQFFKFCETFNF